MELPIVGMCNWGPTRQVSQGGALGPKEVLIPPPWPLGQPAADSHSSGHKGACLGGDAHLSRLHPPGRWAKDTAVRTGPGLGCEGAGPRWGGAGLARPGLTRAARRLCVCEDPRLRRRRGAPPLGELRVPLRKLVPNRARSFDVCLEKRKLVSGADTDRGGDQHPCGGEAGKGTKRETLGGVRPR